MGSFLCKTEENVWLFIPLSHREGPKEKHCSSKDVQSAFIFSVEDTVYLSGIIRHQMTKRANFIKRVRNEDLPNSVMFTVK